MNNLSKIKKLIFPMLYIFIGIIIGFLLSLVVKTNNIKKENLNSHIENTTIKNEINDSDTTNIINGLNKNVVVNTDKTENNDNDNMNNNIESISPLTIEDLYNNFSNSIENKKVGETFLFGKFEQDNNTGNGKEDIEWIILYKSNKNSMMLISKYILDCKPYNFENINITWEDSELRRYLNNDFYESAFDDFNKHFIMQNEMSNSKNINYKTDGGNNTFDRVFLLSESQAKKYFAKSNKNNQNESRSAIPTEYAKNKGIYVSLDKNEWYGGNASYWLRTPGIDTTRAMMVQETGELFNYGEVVSSIETGVRPCIWIKY